jgi:hypothetical protein
MQNEEIDKDDWLSLLVIILTFFLNIIREESSSTLKLFLINILML